MYKRQLFPQPEKSGISPVIKLLCAWKISKADRVPGSFNEVNLFVWRYKLFKLFEVKEGIGPESWLVLTFKYVTRPLLARLGGGPVNALLAKLIDVKLILVLNNWEIDPVDLPFELYLIDPRLVFFKNASATGVTQLALDIKDDTIDPYIPDNGIMFSDGAYFQITGTSPTGLTVFYDG